MTKATLESITREAVRRYLDGLNALDPALAVSGYSPDATIRYPGQPRMGVQGFRNLLEDFFKLAAEVDITPQEVFETEHGVAARWTLTVTSKSGRTVTCPGIDSWVLGGAGTIESADIYYDHSPLYEALQG